MAEFCRGVRLEAWYQTDRADRFASRLTWLFWCCYFGAIEWGVDG